MGLPGCLLATILANSSISYKCGSLDNSQNSVLDSHTTETFFLPDTRTNEILDKGLVWKFEDYEIQLNHGRLGPDFYNDMSGVKNPKGIYFLLKKEF